MRTFVALSFSVGTSRRIAEVVEREVVRLKDAGWQLAWVPPANLHVTLKFLGDIAPESIDAIAVKLKQRCIDLPPIALRAKGYGAFPAKEEGAPRVLWIGIEGGRPLAALQQAVESDLVDLGFPKEPRAFHPHLTIARVVEPPADACAWPPTADFDLGTEESIHELIVYESQLQRPHRPGAEYLARARVPFSKTR